MTTNRTPTPSDKEAPAATSPAIPNTSPPVAESPKPEPVKKAPIGTFAIVSDEFAPFALPNGQEGLSITAKVSDGAGHDTEYSVSFLRNLDKVDEVVATDESDEELQQRLRDAVVEEINNPIRSILIANRFK